MNDSTPRIAAGLLGLALLWIGLYWWWPTPGTPRAVTAANQPANQVAPTPTPTAVPEPSQNPIATPTPTPTPTPTDPTKTERIPEATDHGDANTSQTQQSRPQPPAVIPPEFLEHTLAPGETYATLSLKYYGTAAYATSIAKANPLASPASLKPGRVLRVPKDPKNVQGLPVREPGKTPKGPTTTYTVLQGDSLSTISQRLYGESKHAKFIYEANRATMKDEHSLRVGQKLIIPPKPVQ
jgi:nucleoid-associated protein YgaU